MTKSTESPPVDPPEARSDPEEFAAQYLSQQSAGASPNIETFLARLPGEQERRTFLELVDGATRAVRGLPRTSRPSFSSRAAYTLLIPPAPISPVIRERPATSDPGAIAKLFDKVELDRRYQALRKSEKKAAHLLGLPNVDEYSMECRVTGT